MDRHKQHMCVSQLTRIRLYNAKPTINKNGEGTFFINIMCHVTT